MDKNQYILKLKKLKDIVDEKLSLETSKPELDKLNKQYSNIASKFLDNIKDFFSNISNDAEFVVEIHRVFNKEGVKLLKFVGYNYYIETIKLYAKNTLDADNFASFKLYMNILKKAENTLDKNKAIVAKVNYQAIRSSFILIGCAIICIALSSAACSERIRLEEFTNVIKNLDIKKLIWIFLKISHLGLCAFIGAIGLSYIVVAVKNFKLEEETFSKYVDVLYGSMTIKILRKLISFGIILVNELMKLIIA